MLSATALPPDRLVFLLLIAQALDESVQRPSVMRILSEIFPIDLFCLGRLPRGQENRAQIMSNGLIPQWRFRIRQFRFHTQRVLQRADPFIISAAPGCNFTRQHSFGDLHERAPDSRLGAVSFGKTSLNPLDVESSPSALPNRVVAAKANPRAKCHIPFVRRSSLAGGGSRMISLRTAESARVNTGVDA